MKANPISYTSGADKTLATPYDTPGQIWKNGGHWNYLVHNMNMYDVLRWSDLAIWLRFSITDKYKGGRVFVEHMRRCAHPYINTSDCVAQGWVHAHYHVRICR